jgi:hypothetical protein
MTLVNYYFNRTRKQPADKGAITGQLEKKPLYRDIMLAAAKTIIVKRG